VCLLIQPSCLAGHLTLVIAHDIHLLTWRAADLVMHGLRERNGGGRKAFFAVDVTCLFESVSFLLFQIVTSSHILTLSAARSATGCHVL
jgi:hypothetical protein